MMQAAVLESHGPVDSRPLRLKSVAVPEPGRDQALIRVHACGVCRTDLHVVEGELPARLRPIIPGHQVVGVVEGLGPGQHPIRIGDRVGVAWLHHTCGVCRYCISGRENLCDRAEFTGYTANGGFAQFMVAPSAFVYPLPAAVGDAQTAPLLCAGIIGFRSLEATGLRAVPGVPEHVRHPLVSQRLGIYGFGAAGHIVIQLARGRGIEVYVCTRDRDRHQQLATELGAAWVGGAMDAPPEKLDAAIIFAPAGELVRPALETIDKGGTLVLGGIHMSDIPALPYRLLYGERVVRSVANNTRADGHDFLLEASALPVKTSVQEFPLADVNEALCALKHDAIRGAAIITMK